jgi:hypothetical protein
MLISSIAISIHSKTGQYKPLNLKEWLILKRGIITRSEIIDYLHSPGMAAERIRVTAHVEVSAAIGLSDWP